MRYLTSACPEFRRVLLVESGSRRVLDLAIPRLRQTFGPDVRFDLLTCYAGAPEALEPEATVWRTQDFATAAARDTLVAEVSASGVTVAAIVCSGEPIMTRWKWWLAWRLPAKILIVNENDDCFWLDTANVRTLRTFVKARLGLQGGAGLEAAARVAMLPFVMVYLLLFAAWVHTRRAFRLRTHSL